MTPTEQLLAARTDTEIVTALYRGAYRKRHKREPDDPEALAPADLAAWRSEWPADVIAECARLLTDLLLPTLPAHTLGIWKVPLDGLRARFKWELRDGAIAALAHIPFVPPDPANLLPELPPDADTRWLDDTGTEIPTTLFMPLTKTPWRPESAVHDKWCSLPAPRPRHPLAPLVDAWQQRPTAATPFVPVNRASLPRLARMGTDEARLPGFPEHDAPETDGQLLFDLPGIGAAVRGCTSWLLWLFDAAGGQSLSSGRGAPWDLRMFVYALLHLDVHDRDGEWHTLRFAASPDHSKAIYEETGRRIPNVEDWLFPNGWANKRRDWENLPTALDRMLKRLSYVPVDGIGSVATLIPSVIPRARSHPIVEFTARVPAVAAEGDRLNWPRLVEYGADSARLFRAYLAVVAWLGRSARSGHPITRMLPAPVLGKDGRPKRARVLGPDGKPKRDKAGKIQTRIIRSATERIDNPAVRYVGPPLSEHDLTRMIGFDPTEKNHRRYTRAAFKRMESDGVIEIDRSGDGVVIYGGPNW